ncbi:MAG: DsbA family protein [Candidatus Pelagibacterales bacterium]|jgi:protein-disulfide isomerase|tara:strand:+ start:9532 stop:10140 length:609 start_codon:yes stop_codon:yes gene_type:complete
MNHLKKIIVIGIFIILPNILYAEVNLANFVVRNLEASQTPSVGNLNASYTIVEFFDYRCGYCAKQAKDFAKIINDKNDVRIIYLEYPIFGGISDIAANIAIKVWIDKPNSYFSIHNGLMKLGSAMNKNTIISLLNENGFEGAKLYQLAESQPYADTIEINKKLAKDLGLRGTPASIINDTMIPGYISEENVLKIINETNAPT